jgi:diguanylate cyclase (GGDEF)-like protein
MEPIEPSKLKQIQDAFSSMTGLSLLSRDAGGADLCEPSLDNPICQAIEKTPQGSRHCRFHCGRSIGMALESREPVFFKCDAGLHVFTIPTITAEKAPRKMAFIGGKAFFSEDDISNFIKLGKFLQLPEEEISRLAGEPRVVSNPFLASSARFLEVVLPFLAQSLYERDLMGRKSARMITLFNLLAQINDERSFRNHIPAILSTLGVLFGLRTASVMVLDPEEKKYRTVDVFGQDTERIADYSADTLSSLVGNLYEKAGPVSSSETLMILRLGLPPEISSVHFIPITVQGGSITGVLGIFDTPLDQEDLDLLLMFCQQVSIYQENKALRFEKRELNKDMSVILEIAKTVGSALESEDLFGIILEKSAGFLQAEQGSLLLMDEDRRELTVKAMKGLNKKIVELLRIRPGEGISGRVYSTGQPLLVIDIESDDRVGQEKRPRYKTKSFISAPLRLNGRIFGVINVADKADGSDFSEEDLHILMSIGTYASVAIERSQFYHKNQELKKISITDSLTSLLNRRYFQERIAEEIERSRRHHLPLSLIMIDIDNFKKINDTYGHTVGDEVLKVTARCLRNCIRTIDVAARYGGEEFTVILPQTGKLDASVIADRICNEIGKIDFPFGQAEPRMPLTVSLGLATYPDDAGGIESLIRNSDVALYRAKTQGKNRVIVYQNPLTA